jgi:hypothetical protein
VAGPWFTVQRSGEDWQTLDKIWISNRGKNARATVEIKVEFEELSHAAE